jgi:hypothetical protein
MSALVAIESKMDLERRSLTRLGQIRTEGSGQPSCIVRRESVGSRSPSVSGLEAPRICGASLFGLIATTRSPGALPSLVPQTVVNTRYFSNMRLKQHSYASAPGKLPSKKARISREQQCSTSGASALRVFVREKLQEFGKMRKQVIAVATAIVLGIATTATGTTAFARGGGGGGGGHSGGLAAEVTALAVAVSEERLWR